MLVIRFLTVRRVDFISEHQKIIQKNGSVWMLKTGKQILDVSLKEVLDSGGNLILKAPKAEGGELFYGVFCWFLSGNAHIYNAFP